MFDQLTAAELETLARKLSHAGSAFYRKAASIADTALYMEKTGRITAGSGAWNGLWALRRRPADAMDEMHELTRDIDEAAARKDGLPCDACGA